MELKKANQKSVNTTKNNNKKLVIHQQKHSNENWTNSVGWEAHRVVQHNKMIISGHLNWLSNPAEQRHIYLDFVFIFKVNASSTKYYIVDEWLHFSDESRENFYREKEKCLYKVDEFFLKSSSNFNLLHSV